MKLLFSLFYLITGLMVICDGSQSNTPQLFNLKGYDIPAEFSDEAHANEIKKDIEKFDTLPPYTPKKYAELDHTSKNLDLEITREILNRGQENNHQNFFEITDEVKNSKEFKDGHIIDYDEFFNNKTGKYEKLFKTKDVSQAMKSLHINDFNKRMAQDKKQLSFVQTESNNFIKRPAHLRTDVSTEFLEVSEEAKIASLIYNWEYLWSYNCWASSRWEFGFLYICWYWAWTTVYIWWIFPRTYLRPYANYCIWIWFLSYPCSTQIGGRGWWWFWMSEKLNDGGTGKEITFRLEFDVIRRIKFHSLLFMAVPDETKIETSQDQQVWETQVDFYKAPDMGWWWWWWWCYEYHYPPLTFAKSVKIVMKGIRRNWNGNRHGLWWVSFYSQTQTVQILEKTSTSIPRCIARAEVGYYQKEKPFILMNCLDAILQNDSREAFFLNQLFVQQWADWMCVSGGYKAKSQKLDTQFITSQQCKDSDDYRFVIDRLGKFMSKAKPTSCIAAQEDDLIKQVQPYGYVYTSASLSDSRVNPYAPIDPNTTGFWASPVHLNTAIWQLTFDRSYLVEEITVNFKFIPKKVVVNVLSEYGLWFSIYADQPGIDLLLQIGPTQIRGVQLHFVTLDYESKAEFQKPVYGLKKILIKRPGYPYFIFRTALSFQTCGFQGKDSKIVNRFKVEQIEYIDTSFLVPHRGALYFMHHVYENTKKIVEEFVINIVQYQYVVRTAEHISLQIKQINIRIDYIYSQLVLFKESIKSEGSEASGSCYGCSSETAAIDCYKIKKKTPMRQNGYFWIKSKCMPEATRVYCDFSTGDTNFYLYVGNKKDKQQQIKANSIPEVQEVCNKFGLKPIEIKSKEQIATILIYLNEIQANSEDEYGIPLGVQWDKKKIIFGDKFQSFNSPQSAESTSFLKAHMQKESLIDKLQTIGADTIMIKRSKDKLYKDYLFKAKVRGVVCSENIDLKKLMSEKQKGNCDTTLMQLGDPKIGTSLNVDCPSDCGNKQNFKIYGKAVYKSSSSICRAAVHHGEISDIEGGPVEVKVLRGILKYVGSIQNDIKSLEENGSLTDKAFSLVKRPIAQECPNLSNKPQKKSFISFNEIINKVRTRKQASFIESKEQSKLLDKLEISSQSEEKSLVRGDEGGASEPQMDMKKAIGYVKKQLKNRLVMIHKYIQFVQDTEKLFKQYELVLASIFGSSLNPSTQNQLLSTTVLRIKATKILIQDLTKKGQARLSKYMEIYLRKLDSLFFLQRWEPHHEKYELDYQSSYNAIDAANVKNGPSKWKFTKEDVFPHKQAITQVNPITCGKDFQKPDGDCTATLNILKYKKFYDFKMTVDFKVRQQGFFGFVFRQRDNYNYYSFELKNEVIQFRRMKDGIQKVISSANIDKVLSDTWYNVELTVVDTVFIFKLGKETSNGDPKKYDSIKQVLKGEDAFFKNGYQGILTDGTLSFYLDNYKIDYINCYKDPFNIVAAIKYLQPQASRVTELYKSDFSQVWLQNPKENFVWKYEKNVFKRKKALIKKLQRDQNSISPLVLRNAQLNKGWVGFDLNRQNKISEFSLIFYLKNDKNYFEFVIINDQFVIREVEDGKKIIVVIQQRKDIRLRVWYTYYIQITSTNIEIFFEESLPNPKDRLRQSVFLTEIARPVQKGKFIGFNLHQGTVAIDKFILRPGKVPASQYQKSKTDNQNSSNGDSEPEKDDEDQNNPNQKQSCQESGTCKKQNFFDYKICLNQTETQKEKWCFAQTGGLMGPQQNCKQNFCSVCCEGQIPASKQNIQQECITKCSPSTKIEADIQYKQCFSSKDPKHTTSAICMVQFPAKVQKGLQTQCKTDFCDMCCSVTPLMIQKGMKKDDMDDCFKSCHEKFSQ